MTHRLLPASTHVADLVGTSRQRWAPAVSTLWCVLLAGLLLPSGGYARQAPAASPVHVVKISSGPSGTVSGGSFILTEERSIFSRTADKEIVVVFQWDGVAGPHKLVAQWRSPDGGTSTSSIDYVARDRRFGAYWTLPITPTMPLGMWTIEATVDGQPAGRHTFELRDERVEAAVSKRPLTHAQLYERLDRMFVVLERATADGQRLEPVGGLLANSGRVYTSLAAVDATDVVRAVASDGSRHNLTVALAMNRSQDWIVLSKAAERELALPVAAAENVSVGDRCFSMEGAASGARVLAEGSITGQSDVPGVGRRLLATFLTTTGTPGAPVLDAYGDLVGIVGGGPVPGAITQMELLRFRSEMKGTPIIPFTVFRVQENAIGEPLVELQRRGELVQPLSGGEHVVSGGFARGMQKGAVTPIDQRDYFTLNEKTFVAFGTWLPQQRLRGLVSFRMYDTANRLVMESKPAKVDYRKEQLAATQWQAALPSAPGLYRVDLVFDGKPMWRGFVRVSE